MYPVPMSDKPTRRDGDWVLLFRTAAPDRPNSFPPANRHHARLRPDQLHRPKLRTTLGAPPRPPRRVPRHMPRHTLRPIPPRVTPLRRRRRPDQRLTPRGGHPLRYPPKLPVPGRLRRHAQRIRPRFPQPGCRRGYWHQPAHCPGHRPFFFPSHQHPHPPSHRSAPLNKPIQRFIPIQCLIAIRRPVRIRSRTAIQHHATQRVSHIPRDELAARAQLQQLRRL